MGDPLCQVATQERMPRLVGLDVQSSFSVRRPIEPTNGAVLIGVKKLSRLFSAGPISQISRSPSLPLFVPKLIKEPFGETEYAIGFVAKLVRRST